MPKESMVLAITLAAGVGLAALSLRAQSSATPALAPAQHAPATTGAPEPAASSPVTSSTPAPTVEVSREDAFAGRLAMKVYSQIRAAKVNAALLTPEMQAQLTPEKLAEIKPGLDALGDPEKIVVTGHKTGPLGTSYECVAFFPTTQLHIQMYVTLNSKVGGYAINP